MREKTASINNTFIDLLFKLDPVKLSTPELSPEQILIKYNQIK